MCIDEEIPFEIPKSWEWTRVSAVFILNPKNNDAAADDISAFIPMEKIDATYLSSFCYYEKKWKDIKSGFTHFSDGDIAFAKITPCFQNRKSMILHDLPNGIGAGTTELKVLRPIANTIVADYVLFFLESPYFVEEASFKGTANQQRIISGYLENKLFPLPPYEEQKRIVDIVEKSIHIADKYNKAQITLDNLNNTLSSNLKKSILLEAIQGKLVPQIVSEGNAEELLAHIKHEKECLIKEKKIKGYKNESVIYRGDDNRYLEKFGENVVDITDEIPFEIPENWIWVRFNDIAEIYTGNSINETEKKTKYEGASGIPYIGTKDVSFNNTINYSNGIAIPFPEKNGFRIAKKDSVLMCIEGGSAGRKISRNDRDVCFGNKLCCFTPFVEISAYLYYYMQSPSFVEIFHSNKVGIIGGVSVNTIKQLLIALPPMSEIKRIVQKLNLILH